MKLLTILGAAIAIGGLIFVGRNLLQHSGEISSIQFTPALFASFLVGIVISILSGFFQAFAWGYLIKLFGGHLRPLDAVRIYGLSQIGKYLPGNVFHFVGRQALGQSAGLPGEVVLKSTGVELLLIAFLASPFALVAAPAYFELPHWFCIGAFLFALASFLVAARRWHTALGWAAFWQLGYLLGMSFTFYFIFRALEYSDAFLIIAAVYTVSWLIGFVTPGAPAGVGVREAVLYSLLAPIADPAIVGAAVILGRVANVAGDLLFFLAAGTIHLIKQQTK